jgi:hypothetical protein|tara:strand:+ start:288 stop:791 length:504 start_codon:yes stop_codon:yes gene_type:complete
LGQEYFINNQQLQSKVDSLLPSQGGAGAGFDLSASTQIIPIIDLTESAEGSNLRQDLQSSLSFNSVTAFDVTNTTTTIINNTGYFRIFGTFTGFGITEALVQINDGATDKDLISYRTDNSNPSVIPYDFIVFLEAGHSIKLNVSSSNGFMVGCTRQIATIDEVLVNP